MCGFGAGVEEGSCCAVRGMVGGNGGTGEGRGRDGRGEGGGQSFNTILMLFPLYFMRSL